MKKENATTKLIHLLNEKSEPFSINKKSSYTTLIEKIGDARLVLIGEASHGTHEFYQARSEITKQLILQKGFMAIAIEGDWPDAYHINRYLKGMGDKKNPEEALSAFSRFPTWMWANTTILPFLHWLRTYNDSVLSFNEKIGFYGLDLYSLQASMHAVIEHLQKIDPLAAQRAEQRYACFDHMNFDPENYGYLSSVGLKESCAKKAAEQLIDLQHHTLTYMRQDGTSMEDELFYIIQNARIVKNAENYYRTHFEGRVSSWNLRDRHMAETITVLSNHLETQLNKPAKIIIWAHNSHVGDARATEMSEQGELNIGQLIREQYGTNCYLIGFSTYQGWVRAASSWGEEGICQLINPGLHGSYEDLFHRVKHNNFMLNLTGDQELEHFLHIPRLQRAIGVIYQPETERMSHYFFTQLPYQFDTIIHIDQTTAVAPLNLP